METAHAVRAQEILGPGRPPNATLGQPERRPVADL